jgi:uncharacterized membrane protein YphA (DoxX/SURF4 family)
MKRFLGHPITGHVCRLLLGGAFVYANATKLVRADEVARLIYGYRILHPDLVNLAGIAFPWVELIPGALLVIGILPRSAATLLGGLLGVFIGAAALVMMRHIDIECGCFLPLVGDRVDWIMIVRNAILILLALQVMVWPTSFLARRRL